MKRFLIYIDLITECEEAAQAYCQDLERQYFPRSDSAIFTY